MHIIMQNNKLGAFGEDSENKVLSCLVSFLNAIESYIYNGLI